MLRPLLATTLLLTLPTPAFAADARPSGYLERGTVVDTDEGRVFVPDADSGNRGGRYFRLNGSDMGVFYGLGSNPALDWLWPTHRVYPGLKDIVDASPGGHSAMMRYEDLAEYTQGFARAGMIVAIGGIGSLVGGLAYNLLPGNTREMQPVWFGVSAAVGAAGLGVALAANGSAAANEAYLDQAIDAYNRDLAGRRQQNPVNPFLRPTP